MDPCSYTIICWQKNTQNYVDTGQELKINFTWNIRMGKMWSWWLSGMVVGERLVLIFKKLLSSWEENNYATVKATVITFQHFPLSDLLGRDQRNGTKKKTVCRRKCMLSCVCEPVPPVASDSSVKHWHYLYLFSASNIPIYRPNQNEYLKGHILNIYKILIEKTHTLFY